MYNYRVYVKLLQYLQYLCFRPTEFTCDNGECISKYSVCDGAADCADTSDEILKTCQSNQCSDYLYRCKYGACVDGDAVCNDIVDCIDGSDEIEQICRFKPVTDE